MKKVNDFDVEGKKVILRCDFNVSMENGRVVSDKKIVESLETINYLLEHKAKIIIMSHLGKVKEESDKKSNSLYPIYMILKNIVKTDIKFSHHTRGKELESMISKMNVGEIILIENTRFEDLDGFKESKCDEDLSAYWASLGEIFINDAFGMIHRRHASNYGISKHLENGIGFLIKKELDGLEPIVNPKHPFVVIMGGAKVDDKIDLINNIITKCDYLIVGGGIANTFLSINHNIGMSLVSEDKKSEVKKILDLYKDKIIMPIDFIVSSNAIIKEKALNEIEDGDIIGDIGKSTISLYKKYINDAATIFINGTVGIYEKDAFLKGTKEILKAISESNAISVVGGGDALTSAQHFNINNFTFVSTGGGASLYYIGHHKFNCLD